MQNLARQAAFRVPAVGATAAFLVNFAGFNGRSSDYRFF